MFQFEKNALLNFFNSIEYPVNKQKLIDLAKDRDLPLQLIAVLQRLPDREFSSADEINHELTVKAA
jgi:hypothetical protein